MNAFTIETKWAVYETEGAWDSANSHGDTEFFTDLDEAIAYAEEINSYQGTHFETWFCKDGVEVSRINSLNTIGTCMPVVIGIELNDFIEHDLKKITGQVA